jgi:uncharacterized protein (UPF0333 family)
MSRTGDLTRKAVNKNVNPIYVVHNLLRINSSGNILTLDLIKIMTSYIYPPERKAL